MADLDDYQGRRKHLGRLALIFYHRRGSWQDLGNFLEALFERPNPAFKGKGFHVQSCRHSPGGLHYDTLQAAAVAQPGHPVFNHERYWRVCLQEHKIGGYRGLDL